jgi:ABC-type phosphate transport system substrate-binding protein
MERRDSNPLIDRRRRAPTRRRVLHALLGVVATLAAAGAGGAETSPEFVVIVHAENPAASVPRQFLADAFLKKVTAWEHDEKVRPVDQHARVAARAAFSKSVLRRSVAAVRQYWLQRIFAGRDVPPPEVGSDALVVRFVAAHAGAVGYVSPAAVLHGVKIVHVR